MGRRKIAAGLNMFIIYITKLIIIIPEEAPQAADQSNQITEMSIKDIGKILERLNLHEYVDSFAGALVDGMILKEFDKTTLEEFGFKSIESIRLLKFIQCGHIPK